jgi:hypothetical protein
MIRLPEKDPIISLSLEQQLNYHIDMAKHLLGLAKKERIEQEIKAISRKKKEKEVTTILKILETIPILPSEQILIDSKAKELIKEIEQMKVPDSPLPISLRDLAKEHIKKAELLKPKIEQERKKAELAIRMEMARLELIRRKSAINLDLVEQPSKVATDRLLKELDDIVLSKKAIKKSLKYYKVLSSASNKVLIEKQVG